MKKLEVGDKVWLDCGQYGAVNYVIQTIERTTPTTAITQNGIKLQNKEPQEGYPEIGNSYRYYSVWRLLTPEKEAEIKAFQAMQSKKKWVKNQQLTDEQYVLIYDLLNKKE